MSNLKKQSAETYKRNPGPKKKAFKTTYAKNAVSVIWNWVNYKEKKCEKLKAADSKKALCQTCRN